MPLKRDDTMTRLLFIRHGESMANIQKRFAGNWDIPLSENGVRQAETAAAYVTAQAAVDAVVSSDLQRAAATGKAIAVRAGCPSAVDPALREIFAGDWEGMTFDELERQFPRSYAVWRTDIGNARCDNGESVAELQARVVAAVRRLAAEYAGQTVVVATHATPIRALQCYCAGLPLSKMHTIPWVSNASITEIIAENDALRMVRAGYDDHLGAARTALPKNV